MRLGEHRNRPSTDSQQAFEEGVHQHQAGHPAEAEHCYRQILRADPGHADALHHLGVLAGQVGRKEDTVSLIRRAIAINGGEPAYYASLAKALKDLGRPAEAAAAYRLARCISPNVAEIHFHLANILLDLGRIDDSVAVFATAVQIRSDYASAYVNMGTCLKVLGRHGEAVAAYRAALCLKPDFAVVYSNLGNVLRDLRRPMGSIGSYGAALRLMPYLAEAHSNLGNALRDLNRPTDAIRAFVTALCIRPGHFDAHYNRGIALFELGRLNEAVAAFGAALRVKADEADAHHNLGLALLLHGRFEQGWTEYEWRWQRPGFAALRRCFPQPLWQGEDLAGKTILLHAEQGLGDAMQFCRYAAPVAAKGGRVILEIPRSLIRLITGLPGVDKLVAAGDPLPAFDLHCPLMSLPGLLGTNLDRIPPVPLITADPGRVTEWQKRLRSPNFKIGIVWQGNRHHPGDRDRSVPLALLTMLTKIPGVDLISLQKGFGVDQIDRCSEMQCLVRLGPDYDAGDFMETASVLAALDLVITIDSAVAHLAGTLGVQTWVLLPFVPDWRWLLDRDDTPWYPTLRLFRQKQRGAWHTVLERMAVELGAMIVDRVQSQEHIK